MKPVVFVILLTAAVILAVGGCVSDSATVEPEAERAHDHDHDQADESSQILPESDDRPLERADLQYLDNWQLTLARNEIFARHGRPFQHEEIRKHFEGLSWYSPDPDYDEAWLSQVERENAQFIVEYQKVTYDRPATGP
jgi:hypothetical protein